ncbi:MAG: SfeI methyltransferase [Parcubacteria group bacterium]|nr:SfeI methyltransferase [Parcubacteria group bacterium]
MDYYIKRTSVSIEGGYPCYQKNFIELLGIPNFTPDELGFLNQVEDRKRIDNFLVEKYGIKI